MKAVVNYSGGSDSVFSAAIVSEKFDEIHMLTFYHLGSKHVENTKRNVERIRKRYPYKKYIHHIINLDPLAKYIVKRNYLRGLFKYGFINMAMCSICMLTIHTRVVLYCIDNGIKHVFDGANSARGRTYSHQIRNVMQCYKDFYTLFGIEYDSPAYGETRSDIALYNLGIYEKPDVKFTPEAKEIEQHCDFKCFQHMTTHGYFFLRYDPDRFEDLTIQYYQSKYKILKKLVNLYIKDEKSSILGKLIKNDIHDHKFNIS